MNKIQLQHSHFFLRFCYEITSDFQINENDPDPDNRYCITGINKKPLPYAEAFWNNQPIIFGQMLLSLQNIPNEYENDVCYEGKRKVLQFNSHEWKALN